MFNFDQIGVGVFFLKYIIGGEMRHILYHKISETEAIRYTDFCKIKISSDQEVFVVMLNATLCGLVKKVA